MIWRRSHRAGRWAAPGGFSHYQIAHVEKFRLGPGELDDGAFVVPSESRMNADLAPASGALGSDILNNFDLDLQASTHLLRLGLTALERALPVGRD